MTTPIAVSDYDPRWPSEFERLSARAVAALGDLTAGVEHVGSTAVPGLASKPVIDLDVVVRSSTDVPEAVRRLESAGYRHEGDGGIVGRESFTWPTGEARHHLYVVVDGSDALVQHLRFREHLRAHPKDARAYEELKRSLAMTHEADRTGSTNGKNAFIERVLARPIDSHAADFRRTHLAVHRSKHVLERGSCIDLLRCQPRRRRLAEL